MTPSEIAARAVQEELYARAIFRKLTTLPTSKFLSAVEEDVLSQTEFLARHIVEHWEEQFTVVPPERAVEMLRAARLATRTAEAHIRCRVERALSSALRLLGDFAAARECMRRAETFARDTLASEVHLAVIDFAEMALADDFGTRDNIHEHAQRVIDALELYGANDRAYTVRLYLAWMAFRDGDFVSALAAYQDAARRANELGADGELRQAYYNIAHCYRALGDFAAASEYFKDTALLARESGVLVAAAQAMRCVGRMAVRVNGEAGIPEMDAAKDEFLKLGLAGEVCRSTIAIMEELLRRESGFDVSPYVRQLENEARTFGTLSACQVSLDRLHQSAMEGTVTHQLLQATWDAFGPSRSYTPISDMQTVEN